jgi:23S rRNA (uracil1939-C5)-methyltransferase
MSARSRRERADRLEGSVVEIHDLSHDGRGVAELDGKVLFVWGALPGEQVRVTRIRSRRRFDQAEVAERLTTSADRREPGCEAFGRCGGCALQHLAPEAQLAAKQATLLENYARIGEVRPEEVLAPLTGPLWNYRRRARLSVRHVPAKGRVLVGFKERAAPYVTLMDRCPVLDERASELPLALATLIGGLSIRDDVLQVELAAGDDAMALVFRVRAEPAAADRQLLTQFALDHAADIYLQSGGPDTVLPLDAARELAYTLPAHGVDISFQPTDFIQINVDLNRRMVDQALSLLDLTSDLRVLELYAGLGNFSLPLAKRCRELVAVEGEPQLVSRAQRNAERHGVDNILHVVADLSAPDAGADWATGPFDRVLIDPPRIGAREVLPLIAASGATRLVYVSCHPGSLARDAGELVREHGFHLQATGVMDMFPHTAHVESIALFVR